MKTLNLICRECWTPTINGNYNFQLPESYIKKNINGFPIYKFECSLGHENYCLHENNKYEILYELGVDALIDDYYRESVANFASAYERFHEYCYLALLECKNVEEFFKAKEELRIISKQSERQYGAFCIIFYNQFKHLPNSLESYRKKEWGFEEADNAVNFRNNVIHQGYIPTKEECVSFGTLIASYINNILNEIHIQFPNLLKKTDKLIFKSYELDSIDLNSNIIQSNSFVSSRLYYDKFKGVGNSFIEHLKNMSSLRILENK